MPERVISFEEACSRYIHRYTMEHVPVWARKRPVDDDGTATWYYAPQYRTDREWYENTVFPGEVREGYSVIPGSKQCYSYRLTWPLGQKLDEPYRP